MIKLPFIPPEVSIPVELQLLFTSIFNGDT